MTIGYIICYYKNMDRKFLLQAVGAYVGYKFGESYVTPLGSSMFYAGAQQFFELDPEDISEDPTLGLALKITRLIFGGLGMIAMPIVGLKVGESLAGKEK